jgi:mannosyltransferase PIG-V
LVARVRAFAQAHAEPLAVWLALRVGLTLLAILAGLAIPSRIPGGTAPYPAPALPAFWDRLVGVWAHWDGLWYLQIATAGYHPGDGTTAFLPLYPWAVGLLGLLLGGRYLVAGVILSSLIFAGVLILLYRLVREQYAPDLAPRAVLYLAIFPAAFFFWAIYSEGLFLLLALGMFYAAGRGRWWLAGLCMAAAFWTRPFGVVLIPCLLVELALAWRGRGIGRVARPRPLDVLGALGVPLLAGLALLAWSALALGDPLVFLNTQADWNRAFSWPWTTVANAFKAAAAMPFQYQEENQSWFYLATLLLFVVLAGAGWVRGPLRVPHALYLTLGLLFPLFSATPRNPLLSFPRFVLVLFPAFILLAAAGRRPWLHYLIVAVSLLLLALYTIRFTNWFWVA